MRCPSLLHVGLLVLAASAAPASEPRWVGVPEVREPSASDRARVARQKLETGRSLLRSGKPELAVAALRRGLEFEPEHAALYRALTRAFEALEQPEDAARARARADAIEPPPPPPPAEPVSMSSRGLVVVLLPPVEGRDRVPRAWPEGDAARTLEARLGIRLPAAKVVHADFESVAAARTWLADRGVRAALSLRVERIYCGDTVKDGRFGIATLRGAAERPGRASSRPLVGRTVLDDPRLPTGCRAEVVARALEEVLAQQALTDTLARAQGSGGTWQTAAIRTLFPGLGERIDAELAEGERLLSQGRLELAAEVFRRAERIDPDDAAVHTYLREALATLALSRELSARGREADAGVLEPRFSAAQIASLEARLAEERRLRDELLATLAVMDEDARLPPARVLASLRPVEVRDPGGFGPTLARTRAGGEVVARAAFAPDGDPIAVYYFPAGDDLPVLREEDLSQDGRADRWIAYAGIARSEIWEAGRDTGRPDLRIVFTGEGQRISRVELDADSDGIPENVFRYRRGAVASEARDTRGDGRLDTFDHFDRDGNVVLREEDLDGDGQIDVRSHYEQGRLKRRELADVRDET
ncbi:MAG: hypothetical protein QNK04_29585 [Myxococcota bacterium]|nr:hypothetical protein [Myxococcota bacterium]